MEIGVRIESEDPLTGERLHCCSAYLTFVAIDEQGKTQQLPALSCIDNRDSERRREEAQERRDLRLRIREIRKSGGVLRFDDLSK